MATDIDIIHMSSKGQIVIPNEMRGDFKAGDKFVVIKNGDQIILKSVRAFSKGLQKDIEFARRTEAALVEYDKGKHKSLSKENR